MILLYYYMAQVTSSKIARCDWLLTWRNFSVMTPGIMKIVNALWKKKPQNPKQIIFKKKISLKTKQNTEMSKEELSDSEFYYPEEQETVEER